jgi:hypothetical protein
VRYSCKCSARGATREVKFDRARKGAGNYALTLAMTVKRATMARFRSIADAIPASVPAGESEVPAAIEATMIGRAKERSVERETSSPEFCSA